MNSNHNNRQAVVVGHNRVSPPHGQNIRNMKINMENINKKQTDKQRSPATHHRNPLEHTGTTLHSLFHQGSIARPSRKTRPSLVNQGLQQIFNKPRSAAFRLRIPNS